MKGAIAKRLATAVLGAWCLECVLRAAAGIPLVQFKEMVPVKGDRATVDLAFAPATYQLKIKQPKLSHRVLLNGKELPLRGARRKKEIETDYYVLQKADMGEGNRLEVVFAGTTPRDVDVRLHNYIPMPSEMFSNDVFLLYRGNYRVTLDWARLCLDAALLFLLLAAGIGGALAPVAGFSILAAVNNLLPLNPYVVQFTPFFFWVSAGLSVLVLSRVFAPAAKGERREKKT